jgi:Carboxypeptidase regulatory-like domain
MSWYGARVMIPNIRFCRASVLTIAFVVSTALPSFAQVGGSLSGTVKDSSGGVVPGVSVSAVNTILGTEFNTVTDGQGLYTFPKLPVGKYTLTLVLEGFKPQKRAGIQVDADSASQINVTLEIGEQSETVTVSVNAIRVDTVSTQLGEVVPSTTMTSLSLNGRSYTDLLSIQPGVIPTTTIQPNSVIMAGVTGPVAP